MKKQLLRFTLSAIIIYLTCGALNLAIAASQLSVENGTHFCGVIDPPPDKRYSDQYPNRRYARASAANLNVGEPRTVRMIYFLPNDWQYRADVVQQMKDTIRTVQTFYAEQMGAHGYGEVTFRFETDLQGEPMVHRVDGDHPFSYYDNTLGTEVSWELQQAFDFNANIYFVVLGTDALRQGDGAPALGVGHRFAKNGGDVLVPNEFSSNLVTHELGHTFGLNHDFRDGAYIMSYGGGERRSLSVCAAEFLSVHSYFNPDTPIEEEQLPTIELISPRTYPPGSTSVPVRVQVSDSDGLHQVLLHALGALQLCRKLTGEKDAIVEFDYDGGFGQGGFTSFSSAVTHRIRVDIVDTDGNVSDKFFGITESSPHHIATLEGHTDRVHSVSFSPDGTILASGGDTTAKLWDVATRQNLATLEGHRRWVNSVSFSPDGGILATGGGDWTVNLWDVATRQNIGTVEDHQAWIYDVSFSSDGGTLAWGNSKGEVKLWDVATRQNIATLTHGNHVFSVSFSPDGTILASGDEDRTVKLWDVATRQNIATLLHEEIVLSVSFSPDGTILASGGWGGIELWDVATETNFATLMHGGTVSSVSFSLDGETLASGGWDSTVKLWDVATGEKFATLPHTSAVYSVSFSPNGRTLASGTVGGTVELWDMSRLMEGRLEALTEVDIPDPNLRAAVATALGKLSSAPIVRGNMATLTRLDARNANISDLTGLEGATNLRTLNLGDNNISDISAVAGLTKLRTLYLVGNSISDISPVANLTNLTTLNLRGNSISDISPVANLTNLTTLELGDNSISDISAVSGLTNLTYLELWGNSVSDISAVAGLTNLTWLSLGSSVSDISAVARLTNLTRLNLWNNSISDISAVAGLTKLQWLELRGNNISDISSLVANAGLGSGDTVNVWRNPLSYQSIHTHIPTLQQRGVTVEFNNRTPAPPLKISGDDQQAAPGTTLEHPFVVEVRDQNGEVFAGVPVTFAITAGGGTLSVTNTIADANGRAQSILTLGPNPETNTISVSATRIAGSVTFHAISDIPFIEYILSIPAGTSLIHVPLKVTAVDKIEKIIESVGDLYDALGGASVVNFLITYDSQTQEWRSFFVSSDKGTLADVALTDATGIIAGLKARVSVQLSGDPLGIDGSSTITLSQGLNLVGLPLRDPRISRVRDLFALDGIGGNVPVIILTDNGEFKAVGRADDPGDIAITGGQAFIMTAQREAMVTISGDGWYNVSEVAAGPPLSLKSIEVGHTTPVLGVRGSIIDEGTGVNNAGLRVRVKNLSTGRAVAAVAKDVQPSRTDKREPTGVGYQVTIVDVETGRAARIGDILEVSVRSPSPLIGVQPLQYTVTAEDVKRGLIQLTELVAYEIPAETELLHNYPNPFNPETWIPYRLAEDAFVTLTIYDLSGHLVRTLEVGHRIAAVYENQSKAVYWDGRNEFGEGVASGVYFYHLSAGDYSATRKMMILK